MPVLRPGLIHDGVFTVKMEKMEDCLERIFFYNVVFKLKNCSYFEVMPIFFFYSFTPKMPFLL